MCTKENLERGLFVVSRSVDQKASLPILSTILFETKEGRLKLSSTNLEIGITCRLGGHVKEEGKIAVPVKILNDYVSSLPDGKITLRSKDDTFYLTSGDFSAEVKGMPSDEFPLIPRIKGDPLCIIKGEDLKQSLLKTVFATALDESRPEISGILISFNNEEMKLVATDGYRLAEKTIKPIHFSKKEDKQIILPSKTAHELSRILNGEDEKVELYPEEGQIKASFKDSTVLNSEIEIVSKLVEGNYPNYQEIIPKDFHVETEFLKEDLLSALKAVSLFAKKETSEVNFFVDPESKEIILNAQSLVVGKNSTKVGAEIKGESLKIAFNYHYLLEGLSVIKSEKVIMLFSGADGPALLKSKEDFRYIIMPLETE